MRYPVEVRGGIQQLSHSFVSVIVCVEQYMSFVHEQMSVFISIETVTGEGIGNFPQ